MKAEKKSILKGVIISGMMAGALPMGANANSLLSYDVMGSGSELRSELLEQYGSPIDAVANMKSDYVLNEAKCGEGKCGEGKCGEESKKEGEKTSTKEVKKGDKKAATAETKTSEATCGDKAKEATKTDSKGKTTEAKCGENTCGGEK